MKIGEIADHLNLAVEGDRDLEVKGLNGLEEAGPEELSFLVDKKHLKAALDSAARALVAPPALELPGKTVIRSDNPYLSVVKITPLLHPPRRPPPGVHPSAVVGQGTQVAPDAAICPNVVLGDNVRIGARSIIGPGSVIEDGAVIGQDCLLHPNVTICWGCVVGDRVIIHAGTVIGSDGYGYLQLGTHQEKIPHLGRVVLEDDVEMGSNNSVDRGTYGQTVIGRGTKIDNLVHIAHNVRIGEHSIILAQAGFAGSTQVGERFIISGQAGVVGHLSVPEKVTVGPKSLLIRPGKSGDVYYGIPGRPYRDWQRSVAQFNTLPKLVKRMNDLLGKEDQGTADEKE
ncbi:MAG: UDP-3-O-(3-hydroxymyristoyl)glucosamine N-acyltransferase [Deltaproteobacteria bacterium]|nr:UDP-3-O-(3-hydroxymyristoyl)glucosamine N-acyltransferase [Deltaproteobacteria bacterium]